jgi:ribonuclease HII
MVIVRQTGNIKKNSFEFDAWQRQTVIVGIDEVGRGCFAGPVVAAAVVLPLNKTHRMLKDSKIMTAQEREAAFLWIKKHCNYGVGIVHHRIIDQRNIWHATLTAMKKALMTTLDGLPIRPSAIVTDAMPLNLSDTHFHDIPVYCFAKGESRSSSIAAASIVAKVTRDAMMGLYDLAIPGYGLAGNKGYGTPAHKKAIREQSYSFIHRMHFVHNFLQRDGDVQLSLHALEVNNEAGKILCRSD